MIDPCPTCKGNCCLNYYSDEDERVPHVEYSEDASYNDRGYVHACPDCDDGTYEVCSDPEPFVPPRAYEQGVEEGERRERAAVVAWLNAEAERVDCGHIEVLADSIERGEHRREEER